MTIALTGALLVLCVPQLISAVGWVIYAVGFRILRPPERSRIATESRSLDVIIPTRGKGTVFPKIVDDLRGLAACGGNIVLLETIDDPAVLATKAGGARAAPLAASGWRFLSQDGIIHAFGPPPPGFKSGPLNLWMSQSRADVVVVFDDDWRTSVADVLQLSRHLASCGSDVAFVQGQWEFLNGDATWVSRADSLSLALHHRCEMHLRSLMDVPFHMNGSFMALRRDAVRSVGGFDGRHLSEDLDLAMRLYRAGFRGVYLADLWAQGRVVQDLVEYREQKARWAAGRMQILLRHGLFALSRGSVWGRAVNLHYLIEFITPVTACVVALGIAFGPLPDAGKWGLFGSLLVPSISRFAMTSWMGVRSGRDRPIVAALYDALLRALFAASCLVLLAGVMSGFQQPWRWSAGKRIMSLASTATLAALLVASPFVQGPASRAGWLFLVLGTALSFALWIWPSQRPIGPVSAGTST